MARVPAEYPISDMHVFPLDRAGGRLLLLREQDHLLRRFGQLELVDMAAGAQGEFEIRAEADRFFFSVGGRARAHLLDLRQGSPSHGVHTTVRLDEAEPSGVLVPFGVACAVYAEMDCRFIILSTHSEAHADDRLATADELQKYASIQ